MMTKWTRLISLRIGCIVESGIGIVDIWIGNRESGIESVIGNLIRSGIAADEDALELAVDPL